MVKRGLLHWTERELEWEMETESRDDSLSSVVSEC